MTLASLSLEPTRAPGPIHGIGFVDAYVRFWRMGFTFAGRASRSEYWLGSLANFLASLICGLLGSVTLGIPLLLYWLAAMIPSLSLAVRRLHDNNRSGAMILLGLIPFGGIVLFIFTVSDSDPAGARFDAAPTSVPVRPVPPAVGGTSVARAMLPPVPPPPAVLPVAATAAPVAPTALVPAPVPLAPPRPPVPLPPSSGFDSPFGEDLGDNLDSTRMASPFVSAEWTVVTLDGTVLPLSSALLVGRAPSGDDSDGAARLVPLDDPTKSVSKTHARIEVHDGGIAITDLHSTNGTKVIASGVTTLLAPGAAWPITTDADVLLGSYALRVQRR